MEEVKIWAIQDESNILELPKTNVETEQLLEDTLVQNPDLLIKGLKLVGRQTPTEGGPLDLLGVDEDGRLVIFELKRGTLSRDAVAQIIDYASDLDAMGLDDLAEHISRNSGKHGTENIENFQDWYTEGFGELEALLPPRMFLVGLGVDSRTERMVDFLANNSNLDISLLTFQGFRHEGRILLAKQVKVEGRGTSEDNRVTSEERRKELLQRSERGGIGSLYADVRRMMSDIWPSSKQYPRKLGFTVRMRPSPGNRRRSYARIDPENGRVRLVFFQQAIELCRDEFANAIESIPLDTWPQNRDPIKDKGNTEIQFLLPQETWNTHKEMLSKITQAVYEALEDTSTEDDLELDPLVTTSPNHV